MTSFIHFFAFVKTSPNAPSTITSLRLLNQIGFGRRSQLALSILVALLMTACQHPTTDPLPANPTKPGSSTATQPGNTTATQPGNTTTTPGSSTTTQPADSVHAYKKVKISWSANDFQEILYDAAGLPVQYASQYVYNQGTGQIRRYVYKLRYSAEKQLTRMDIIGEAGNHYVTYQYTGSQVTQTSEYTADGRLISTCTYQYSAPNRLSQVDETHVFSSAAERRTYQYDAAGNLSLLSTYAKEAGADTYVLQHTLSFTKYDTQRDVENLLFHMPLLPNVTFRTNNHSLKISRERTTYIYNERGYPIQQVRTGPGGSLTATYSY